MVCSKIVRGERLCHKQRRNRKGKNTSTKLRKTHNIKNTSLPPKNGNEVSHFYPESGEYRIAALKTQTFDFQYLTAYFCLNFSLFVSLFCLKKVAYSCFSSSSLSKYSSNSFTKPFISGSGISDISALS